MYRSWFIKVFCFLSLFIANFVAVAQKDTLKIMTYNVLYYGDGCQGSTANYHNYLNTIVEFAKPDVLALVKMASIPQTPEDKYGVAPYGFADSVLMFAMNATDPGKYSYCPFTNEAKANNNALLFYNLRKIGFVNIVSSYANVTDFNTYKLYYKDTNLERTHDTTFLYITVNHDKSGDEFETVRMQQITGEMNLIKSHFKRLPNMINLGDFNLRNSRELCYQHLVATNNIDFKFFDPPFYPDKKITYPADWHHNPTYAPYFTTSTRESDNVPNSCGSGGGAKGWYDHILISDWIVNNSNYIRYIPNSYTTIGNDGNRFRISINNNNIHVNKSAPKEVIDALYRMSNKYPVMVSLEVTMNTTGSSLPDPEIAVEKIFSREDVKVVLSDDGDLRIHIPDALFGQEIHLSVLDKDGKKVLYKNFKVKEKEVSYSFNYTPGTYKVVIKGRHNLIGEYEVIKK